MTPEYWASCGYRLLAKGSDGRLTVTDDFLRSFLASPELAPVADAADVAASSRELMRRLAGGAR